MVSFKHWGVDYEDYTQWSYVDWDRFSLCLPFMVKGQYVIFYGFSYNSIESTIWVMILADDFAAIPVAVR
jgi:hypothetical protein